MSQAGARTVTRACHAMIQVTAVHPRGKLVCEGGWERDEGTFQIRPHVNSCAEQSFREIQVFKSTLLAPAPTPAFLVFFSLLYVTKTLELIASLKRNITTAGKEFHHIFHFKFLENVVNLSWEIS